MSDSCGNTLRSFLCSFYSSKAPGKAFRTRANLWVVFFFLTTAPVLSFRGADGKGSHETTGKGRGLNRDLEKKRGTFSIQVLGLTEGPGWGGGTGGSRQLPPPPPQLLFLCRIWSNSLCEGKANLCFRAAAAAPSPAEESSSGPTTPHHSPHPFFFRFCQHCLPQLQRGWSGC